MQYEWHRHEVSEELGDNPASSRICYLLDTILHRDAPVVSQIQGVRVRNWPASFRQRPADYMLIGSGGKLHKLAYSSSAPVLGS